MSDERPSYPLVSVASNAQAIFSVTQADSRLRDRPSALSAFRVLSLLQGVLLRLDSECTAVESLPLLSTQQASNTLRRLRCEVQSKMCPTLSSRLSCWQRRCQARQAKQSVSVFHQKVHSVMIEVPKLEPCHPLAKKNCHSQELPLCRVHLLVGPSICMALLPRPEGLDFAALRVHSSTSMRFRELSVPESACAHQDVKRWPVAGTSCRRKSKPCRPTKASHLRCKETSHLDTCTT